MPDEPKIITEADAQQIHDNRRTYEPGHDDSSCWCCCIDCGFDVRAVMEASDHAG